MTGQISVCHSDKNNTFNDGDNNGHGLKIVACEQILTFECIYFVSEILYII